MNISILKKVYFQIKKIERAFSYSLAGLKIMLKERAFLQEIIGGIIVCFFIYYKKDKMYIFSSYMLVLIVESLNTAIEKCINRISYEIHPLSKETKDIASFAVFMSIAHLIITLVMAN